MVIYMYFVHYTYMLCMMVFLFFFFKQKTAYEMRISDWSSDVCSSDLTGGHDFHAARAPFLYSEAMAGVQTNLHVANYIEARLAGGTAMHGGDDVKDQARVFGHVYFRATEEDDTEAELLYDLLGERGDRKSTRPELQSLMRISYAVFSMKKKTPTIATS